MATKTEIAKAIRDSRGTLTLLGVGSPFKCQACDESGQYAGGVWVKGPFGELNEHVLICEECSADPSRLEE